MTPIQNVFAFDIETVPDVEFGRRLHGLAGLTDKQVGYVMHTRQREQTGSEFLSLEQQRIVAISIAMRARDGFKVWSLGDPIDRRGTRAALRWHERSSPTLVS
jgi:predicted PolB exonuclease-like 3'-5' exonuclease